MREKIKRNFLLLVFLFITLGLFLPLHSAWAFAWLADAIATAIVIWVFGVFIAISLGILFLAEGLLLFVLSPHFINVPYTTNEFVTLGWTLTRDFANMFFIIVLVIIGLATALRISEYQWQKTLPLLIGVALLINFTPVILGLIIDASNIIMNFFVEGITKESVFSSLAKGFFPSLWKSVKGASLESLLAIIITPIFYIIFNLISAIIFLLFAILFIFRYVALWTLVILSPIAFLCYILPATRGVFNMWWKQFTQWCIIGITCAFFLYLGNQLFFSIGNLIAGEGNIEGLGLLNTLVPYYVVLAFLFIGFFVSLSTSAMGASGVIAGAQRGTKMAGAWVAKKGWEKGRAWTREKMPERVKELGEKMAKFAPKGRFAQIAGAPIWRIGRTIGRVIGPGLDETRKREIRKAEEGAAKAEEPTMIISKIRDELAPGGSKDRAIGLVAGAIKKGGPFKSLIEKELTPEEGIRVGKAAVDIKSMEQAERIARTFLSKIGEEGIKKMGIEIDKDDEKKGYKTVIDKIVGKTTPVEVKELSKFFWENSEAKEAIHKFWSGHQVGEAAQVFGRVFIDKFQEEGNKKGIEFYEANNRPLVRYWYSSATQSVDVAPPPRLLGDWTPPPPTPGKPSKGPKGWIPGSPPPGWKPGDPVPEGWTPPPGGLPPII